MSQGLVHLDSAPRATIPPSPFPVVLFGIAGLASTVASGSTIPRLIPCLHKNNYDHAHWQALRRNRTRLNLGRLGRYPHYGGKARGNGKGRGCRSPNTLKGSAHDLAGPHHHQVSCFFDIITLGTLHPWACTRSRTSSSNRLLLDKYLSPCNPPPTRFRSAMPQSTDGNGTRYARTLHHRPASNRTASMSTGAATIRPSEAIEPVAPARVNHRIPVLGRSFLASSVSGSVAAYGVPC